MKTPEQVVDDVARRLKNTWSATLVGEPGAPAWPWAMPIGQPNSAELTAQFPAIAHLVATWRDWAAMHGLTLRFRARRVSGTDQELPTHLTVPDLESAARICAGDWPARIARGQHRAALLGRHYPHLAQPARVLVAADGLSDVDFDLLRRAADWFAVNDAAGMTPRQVPIEGLHAKWLNTRQALVARLAGVDDLRLAPAHPPRIHFTYLDPAHRTAGGRLHDSATAGDRVALPYQPEVVIISENKDTAIYFPELTGGVSVEGVGRGGGTAAAFGWITHAPRVFYWGDMDADGLEILDGFRGAGIPAASILMDQDAYETWERFGTSLDRHGKPLGPQNARPVPYLSAAERSLYHQLISPEWTRHRRIEQERIPLSVARRQVLRGL
ncbi:Wadjet anti-phage system protein JetD domain-containing protein [Amycolatopsis sp. H20-H5]|uniref:Wadjet anti-phage system protein JetD domain-containing protein n=1 Tax=Amycolatopsis sp. H20-H5 TaxID=3046309 RepID=UPI002DB5FA2B|nr:Wadjet anti-phage system protein JetD domain-containing protein [Amycolatopsis sp. H20-H5]MEC3979825.1 Wadjet anti-phage system protein JetD domain-containing protein [Amycolatopsis sp. H20-H5]